MPDPTESVIIATFNAALGIFIIGSVVRMFLVRSTDEAASETFDRSKYELEASGRGQEIYAPPTFSTAPLPLPEKGIPTWFYNRFDLIGLGFVFFIFFILVKGAVSAGGKEELALDPGKLIAAIAFQFICAAVVSAFVVFRISPSKWLGLRWPGWKWVFLIAPGTVLGVWGVLGALQAMGYMQWIESLGVETVQDTVKLLQQSKDPRVVGLMIVAAVIAAPICEEIVFRGYLYPAAKKFAGPWVAGICSALIFSAAHGSLSALLPLFIFGCVLVFVYEKTGSLWSTIAIHFCFNGATVLIQLAVRYFEIPIPSAQ